MDEFPKDLSAEVLLKPRVEKYDQGVAANAGLLRDLIDKKIRKGLADNQVFVKLNVSLFNSQAVQMVMRELAMRFPGRVGLMDYSGNFQVQKEFVLSGVREYCLDLRVHSL